MKQNWGRIPLSQTLRVDERNGDVTRWQICKHSSNQDFSFDRLLQAFSSQWAYIYIKQLIMVVNHYILSCGNSLGLKWFVNCSILLLWTFYILWLGVYEDITTKQVMHDNLDSRPLCKGKFSFSMEMWEQSVTLGTHLADCRHSMGPKRVKCTPWTVLSKVPRTEHYYLSFNTVQDCSVCQQWCISLEKNCVRSPITVATE